MSIIGSNLLLNVFLQANFTLPTGAVELPSAGSVPRAALASIDRASVEYVKLWFFFLHPPFSKMGKPLDGARGCDLSTEGG